MVAMQCGKIHQQFDENELVTSLFDLFRQLALCKIWRGSKETERQRKDVFSSFHCWRLKLVGPTGREEDGERTALSYEPSYLALPS